MRADAGERLVDDVDRGARGNDGPVGPRDLQIEIRARGVAILRDGAASAAAARVNAESSSARVDRPLEIDARADVVGNVGIDHRPPGIPNSSTWFVRV